MTPERLWIDSIRDIYDAATKAIEFTCGMNFPSFAADEKTAFAVIRAFEIIGEAARSVPEDVRKAHPSVPWQSMTGMRDKLIHAYFGVSLEVVWQTVGEDLPPLLEALQAILAEADSE